MCYIDINIYLIVSKSVWFGGECIIYILNFDYYIGILYVKYNIIIYILYISIIMVKW